MTKTTTFRDLVQRAARRGIASTLPPRPLVELAEECNISRQHIYNLMRGSHCASPWVVQRIADGLGLSVATVSRALAASRQQAALLEASS